MTTAVPSRTRPYRSKRHRPCDVCRRRKHGCFIDESPPCRTCIELGSECTFIDPPAKRRQTRANVNGSPDEPVIAIDGGREGITTRWSQIQSSAQERQPGAAMVETTTLPASPSSTTPSSPAASLPHQPATIPSAGVPGLSCEGTRSGANEQQSGDGNANSFPLNHGMDPARPARNDAVFRGDSLNSPMLNVFGGMHGDPLTELAFQSSHNDFWFVPPQDFGSVPSLPNNEVFYQSANNEQLVEFIDQMTPSQPIDPVLAIHEQHRQYVTGTARQEIRRQGQRIQQEQQQQQSPASLRLRFESGNEQSKSDVETQDRPLDTVDRSMSVQYQYLGPSSEIPGDLICQMMLSSGKTAKFGRFNYRVVSSDPSDGDTAGVSDATSNERSNSCPPRRDNPGILTHPFLVTIPRRTVTARESDSAAEAHGSSRLKRIISPELGSRLVGLFLRYNFPSLPILSRTRLNVRMETLCPKTRSVRALPAFLLAAIYASVESFRRYDPVCGVTQSGEKFPAGDLWDFALAGIMENMSSPSLSLLQAILIYLQRPVDDAAESAWSSERADQWSLLGSAVSIAMRLGLHVDCDDWTIPLWEKRLRRRIWWTIFSEVTWRSLLQGLPTPISEDQWEVAPLTDADFTIDNVFCPDESTAIQDPAFQRPCVYCHSGYDFRFISQLAVLAQDVHHSLFTVAAVKRLAADPALCVPICHDLLDAINEWRSRLPARMSMEHAPDPNNRDYFHPGSSSHLKLASLTLEMLVHRALLRPVLESVSRQRRAASPSTGHQANNSMHNQNGAPAITSETDPQTVQTLHSAIALMSRAITFAQKLTPYDINSFCYSWSRSCFATLSNSFLLLLACAPTLSDTKKVLLILSRWTIILREQSVLFQNMRLGLLRLDSVLKVGLEKVFDQQPHVAMGMIRSLPGEDPLSVG